MKRCIKSEKVIASSIDTQHLEDIDDLAEDLEYEFYSLTGVKFTIEPNSIEYMSSEWFKLRAVYRKFTKEMIKRYFNSSTPFLNQMVRDNKLYDWVCIKEYSDIYVLYSDYREDWVNGISCDYYVDEEYDDSFYDEDKKVLNDEISYVGEQIIDILYSHRADIAKIISEYVA